MSRRRTARIIFGTGFLVVLGVGASAIWVGQMRGLTAVVVVGVLLVLAAGGLIPWYRRWMSVLDGVDAARREVLAEVGRLQKAVSAARGGRPNPN